MLFWHFLVIVAFVWVIFATITDLKKREVPDWLNYSLIVIGLGSRGIYSIITKEGSYILWGLVGFAVFFVFANIMYYTRQWGGGDSKLLMGLGAMFGSFEGIFGGYHRLPFLFTLLINIFLAGTLYGIIYALFLGLKNKAKVFKVIKKEGFKGLGIISILILVMFILSLVILEGKIAYLVALLFVFVWVGIFVLYLMKIIENKVLYKMLDVSKLTEGDWLGRDVVKNKKVICKSDSVGLTKEDIKKLKRNKIEKVYVKEGIPFVPGFLIGFLVSVFFGDVILLLTLI